MKTVQQFLPGLNRTVEVAGLKVKDFDLLTNQQKMTTGDSLNEIFSSCIVDKEIDTNKLLSGDRNALLIGVRRATFGDMYEFQIVSPYQTDKRKAQSYEIDLSLLEFFKGDEKIVKASLEDTSYTFPFKFPVSGKTARCRLTTGADFKKALTVLRGENKATQDLLLRISEIDGLKEEGVPLKRFISEMDGEDMLELNDYYETISPGVDDKISLMCQETGQEFTARLEFSVENFFKRSPKKKTS